jgi:ABC-type sugar transport system permease subunit
MYAEAFRGATQQLGYGSAIAAIILIINLIIATFYLRAGRSRR